MNRRGSVIFVVLILGASLGLFVVSFFQDNATDNAGYVSSPKLVIDDGLNQSISTDCEYYLTQTIGFRPQILEAQYLLKKELFESSPIDAVILGREGYLYFNETADDYLGINEMSDVELKQVHDTLLEMQETVERKGMKFIFTIAPNKNSIYDYMPLNYRMTGEQTNAERLTTLLGDIQYVDLFQVFQQRQQQDYYLTDSHWNKVGAYAAYEKIMKASDRAGVAFDLNNRGQEVITGDLFHMIRPYDVGQEVAPIYEYQGTYEYITPTRSVEEAHIETYNDKGNGRVWIYRDSFGNNLLDYFANTYQEAVFDKYMPYDLSILPDNGSSSDVVIVEIAERNLSYILEYGVKLED